MAENLLLQYAPGVKVGMLMESYLAGEKFAASEAEESGLA